jgi:hypothetical protein
MFVLTTSTSIIALALPLLVVGFAGYRRWLAAQRSDDRRDAFASWAAWNGFEPASPPAYGSTPTLMQQPGRHGLCYGVPIGEETGAVFEWSYTVGSGKDQHTVTTTAAQALLSAGFPHFRVVPRSGEVLDGSLDEHEIRLESVEFDQCNRLLTGRQDDREVFGLFDPDMIVWWIEQGELAPTVEYQMGTLVVTSRSSCDSHAAFDRLLGQAQHIAEGVLSDGLLRRA